MKWSVSQVNILRDLDLLPLEHSSIILIEVTKLMGVAVWGSSNTCDMMEVVSVKGHPQIHIHFLTDKDEYTELGYGKTELCCHGCGQSLLILYENDVLNGLPEVKEEFIQEHSKCKDAGFAKHCPDYRSKFFTLDLRTKNLTDKTKKSRVPKPKSSQP